MKKGIVKFSKEFITPTGLKEWVGIELKFDMNTESPMDVFAKAKKDVCDFQLASSVLTEIELGLGENFPTRFGPPPVINRKPEDIQIGVTVEDILSCEDLNTLWSYKLIVRSDEKLKTAYEIREIELKSNKKTRK